MGIDNGYCSLEQLEEWNGARKAVSKLTRELAIEACSRGIDDYCERRFWKNTDPEARVYDACEPRLLDLEQFGDLISITTLKTDDDADGVYETTWSAGDYQLLPLRPMAGPETKPYRQIRAINRVFTVPYGTGARLGRVQINGTWGWPDIPAKVTQACAMWAARIFSRKESPQGVAGWGDFGMIRVRAGDPDVTDLLGPYQLHPVGVA